MLVPMLVLNPLPGGPLTPPFISVYPALSTQNSGYSARAYSAAVSLFDKTTVNNLFFLNLFTYVFFPPVFQLDNSCLASFGFREEME